MALIFIEKVTQNQTEFAQKVKQISRDLNINPNWLMAVMNSESKLQPNIFNYAGSGAVGLIQFMPSTARDLGTTTTQLAQMSNIEQLDWVKKYIEMQIRNFKIDKIRDYDDMYLIVFYPKAIGESNDWSFPSYVYSQNAGMDMNKDGIITISDFKQFVRKKIPADKLFMFKGRSRYKYHFIFGTIVLFLTILLVISIKKEWI